LVSLLPFPQTAFAVIAVNCSEKTATEAALAVENLHVLG
jgi:hypothetical protein